MSQVTTKSFGKRVAKKLNETERFWGKNTMFGKELLRMKFLAERVAQGEKGRAFHELKECIRSNRLPVGYHAECHGGLWANLAKWLEKETLAVTSLDLRIRGYNTKND